MAAVRPRSQVTAWRPTVPGVAEVFHARFTDHAYPSHVHDDWTLLIVDQGAIQYDLERHHHGAVGAMVTLLLDHPGDEFEAESRLTLIRERLLDRLRQQAPEPWRRPALAAGLRDLLDSRITTGVTLTDAASLLHAHPSHLVRSFTQAYGLPPHRYLTGRRVAQARRLLLAGQPAATVAAVVGFYDQPHMTRHFVRHLGVTPARYAAAAARRRRSATDGC